MYMDKENLCSDAQALTGTANSSDLIDMGGAVNLGGASGHRPKPFVHISAKSGTTPTIAILLVGADDSAFSTNKITIWNSGTLSDPAVPSLVKGAIPSHTPKRYYRFEYTLGGTTPNFTVTSGLVLDEPTAPFGV